MRNLDLHIQTLRALLSLPGSQVELMDLHKIMLQPFLSLSVKFETVIPKTRTLLVSSSDMELQDTTESLA